MVVIMWQVCWVTPIWKPAETVHMLHFAFYICRVYSNIARFNKRKPRNLELWAPNLLNDTGWVFNLIIDSALSPEPC